MKVTVLVDNKTEHPSCCAEWGLSLLIETAGKRILFDAGASEMFARNAEALGVDLSRVDAAVISHGHYDHTGGFPAFCGKNKRANIYLHPRAMETFCTRTPDGGVGDVVGIRWSPEFREAVQGRLRYVTGRQEIFENAVLYNELSTGVPTEQFYRQTAEGPLPDNMAHEQILVVEEQNQLYVFSGCSHVGVLSILNFVREQYPGKRIGTFVAGMHLHAFRGEALDAVLREMSERQVGAFVPLHCTGFYPIVRMKEVFGDRCLLAAAGDVLEFSGGDQ